MLILETRIFMTTWPSAPTLSLFFWTLISSFLAQFHTSSTKTSSLHASLAFTQIAVHKTWINILYAGRLLQCSLTSNTAATLQWLSNLAVGIITEPNQTLANVRQSVFQCPIFDYTKAAKAYASSFIWINADTAILGHIRQWSFRV